MACMLVYLPVQLTVAGPIMTAGATHSQWGLDAAFYRDWEKDYALPASHIRGKLREAMEVIVSVNAENDTPITDWFGDKSANTENQDASWAPQRGMIKVYDFKYKHDTDADRKKAALRHRIRIDTERRVVEPGALLLSEAPFASGGDYTFEGAVEFFTTASQKDARLELIKHAFLFIPCVGAEKTVGCGRLRQVAFDEPVVCKLAVPETAAPTPDTLALSIQPSEPLFIGGVRRTENVFVSQEVIPGAAIKGAFAAGLNRIAGNPDLNKPIDLKNKAVADIFPLMARYFTDLIFLYAVPATKENVRPQTIPLSGVSFDDCYKDIAFETSEENIMARRADPVSFQIDWKKRPAENFPPRYKQPDLAFHPVIRTAIDDETHQADEGMLYSLRMIKPADKSRQPVYWNAQIRFPRKISPEDHKMSSNERSELHVEIQRALSLGLRYIAKRQSLVKARVSTIKPNNIPSPAQSEKFAIVLQTPALMINPQQVVKNAQTLFDDRKRMKKYYTAYWQADKLLGTHVTLKTFYASQELQGGYLGMRFKRDLYRPFYLTSAGSTFVFENGGQDIQNIWKRIEELRHSGLPLPQWAIDTYGNDAWKTCPFIYQNGYGEIVVNTPSNI